MKETSRARILGLATLTFAIAALGENRAAAAPFDVWTLASMERAKPTDTLNENAVTSVQLSAARGEFEAFQIILRATNSLPNVSVRVSDLNAGDRNRIAASNISLYLERFVSVQASPNWHGTNQSLGSDRYPDPLIPIGADEDSGEIEISLPTEDTQPLWVDVFVPRDAWPDTYQGEITIESGDSYAVTIPIHLTVWNFELPLKPSLKSSFGYGQSGNRGMLELLRHKLMPAHIVSEPCTDDCAAPADHEQRLIEQYGLNAIGTGIWSGADRSRCAMRNAPSENAFIDAKNKHSSEVLLYNYTADEVDRCQNLREPLKAWARSMRLSGIRNLVVMAPTPDLFDDGTGSGHSAVDIWVVLPAMHGNSRQYVEQALDKGDEVWSYNTLVQDSYSPKWLIDYAPINFRIQAGFINQSLRLTGLLYWKTDRWSGGAWDEVNNRGSFGPGNYPGEGMLLYRGEGDDSAVLPSMRLKYLRDGVEDFEYVEILKNLGLGAWALEVSQSVGADWTNWTRNPNDLETARRQLGEEIDRLSSRAAAGSRKRRPTPARR